jgi:hypothetical protein
MTKTYYASAYDPNAEASAPDCMSTDGETPDPGVAHPVCDNCATCEMNAFGSGRNANGQPTAGKACTDTKIMAVLYKNDVYQLRVPPASLRALSAYMSALKARRVSPGNVITYIGFDPDVDYIALTFRTGKFIPEAHIPAIMERSETPEVERIIAPPKMTSQQAPSAGDSDESAKPEKSAKKAAPKKAAPKKTAAKKEEPAPEPDAQDDAEDPISDDDISDMLGLGG